MHPSFEIGRRVYRDGVVLRVGNGHHPMVFVPEYFRVSELRAIDGQDGVVSILFKGVPVIPRVSNALSLVIGGIQSVDCDNTICLVRKEARSVVWVYHA